MNTPTSSADAGGDAMLFARWPLPATSVPYDNKTVNQRALDGAKFIRQARAREAIKHERASWRTSRRVR